MPRARAAASAGTTRPEPRANQHGWRLTRRALAIRPVVTQLRVFFDLHRGSRLYTQNVGTSGGRRRRSVRTARWCGVALAVWLLGVLPGCAQNVIPAPDLAALARAPQPVITGNSLSAQSPQAPGATPSAATPASTPVTPSPATLTSQPAAPFQPPMFRNVTWPAPPSLLASVFYTADDSKGIASFRAHASKVGIVAPQCYSLDRWGWLHGAPPQDLMDIAREHHVPVMPLVINRGFSRWQAHDLLYDRAARDRALGQLITHARANGYIGYQIDFEGLWWTDHDAFDRFIAGLAAGLHRHGYILSVAVAARTSDAHNDNFYGYSGVYDYRSLARSADFLSVMAYPEHNGDDPGPLAGYPWVKKVIRYELQFIPADKFSLGVPTYQTDWTRRWQRVSWLKRVGQELRRFFYWTYHMLAFDGQANAAGPLRWDPVLKSSYRVYGQGVHRHVTWVEDARSFAAKLQLIRQFHLRGFSVWRLGLEDPRIWKILPATASPSGAREMLATNRRPAMITVANRYAPIGLRAFPPAPRRVVHYYVVRRYAPVHHYTPAQLAYRRRLAHERYLAELRARRLRLQHLAAERAAAHRLYLERLAAHRRYLAHLAAERRKRNERR
jgi:spore germination protein YaaH